MTEPEQVDVSFEGEDASEIQQQFKLPGDRGSSWCRAELDDVQSVVLGLGYDISRIHFVKGRVEDTIPKAAPKRVSLLRLDTGWYASTKHELVTSFPRLSPGGILIIDDYGHWQGARKAVDEYLVDYDVPIFLSRIDYTGRIGVKLAS